MESMGSHAKISVDNGKADKDDNQTRPTGSAAEEMTNGKILRKRLAKLSKED